MFFFHFLLLFLGVGTHKRIIECQCEGGGGGRQAKGTSTPRNAVKKKSVELVIGKRWHIYLHYLFFTKKLRFNR